MEQGGIKICQCSCSLYSGEVMKETETKVNERGVEVMRDQNRWHCSPFMFAVDAMLSVFTESELMEEAQQSVEICRR